MEDKEILDIYREGGKEDYAFNLIVRKYSERLYWHIRKLVNDHDEANDLVQNTLVKAWRYLPDFREEAKLYTWLHRIATNETLTFMRKEKLRNVFSLTDYESVLSNKLEADPYFNGDSIQKELFKAIRKLPPKQRIVFNLKYFEEMKYEEISEILGGSVGSLKASYHHAYLKIQASLEKNN